MRNEFSFTLFVLMVFIVNKSFIECNYWMGKKLDITFVRELRKIFLKNLKTKFQAKYQANLQFKSNQCKCRSCEAASKWNWMRKLHCREFANTKLCKNNEQGKSLNSALIRVIPRTSAHQLCLEPSLVLLRLLKLCQGVDKWRILTSETLWFCPIIGLFTFCWISSSSRTTRLSICFTSACDNVIL